MIQYSVYMFKCSDVIFGKVITSLMRQSEQKQLFTIALMVTYCDPAISYGSA